MVLRSGAHTLKSMVIVRSFSCVCAPLREKIFPSGSEAVVPLDTIAAQMIITELHFTIVVLLRLGLLAFGEEPAKGSVPVSGSPSTHGLRLCL